MPEGDTIFRTAVVLRRTLVGQRILDARARAGPGARSVPDLTRLIGSTVDAVESHGKHLLIGFDNGLTLRTHMRMRGSWHRYAAGESWRRPAHQARAVLATPDAVAVLFNAPVVELLSQSELRRNRPLRELGPDLLGPTFDTADAIRRLRDRDDEELGTALLDQRALAGIGNVYKSEIAFIERLDPWALVGTLESTQLKALLATARRLLHVNVGDGTRVTTGDPSRERGLWVYGRAGRPCRRCGTLIHADRQGELGRLTYWCPACQPGSPTAPLAGSAPPGQRASPRSTRIRDRRAPRR